MVDPISLVFVSTPATCVATSKSVENLLHVLLMKLKFTRDKRNAPEMWARPFHGMIVNGNVSGRVWRSHVTGTPTARRMVAVTIKTVMTHGSAKFTSG